MYRKSFLFYMVYSSSTLDKIFFRQCVWIRAGIIPVCTFFCHRIEMDVFSPGPINQQPGESQLRIKTISYSIRKVKFDATLCTSCFIVKPPRTHHCRNCGHCIDVSKISHPIAQIIIFLFLSFD